MKATKLISKVATIVMALVLAWVLVSWVDVFAHNMSDAPFWLGKFNAFKMLVAFH